MEQIFADELTAQQIQMQTPQFDILSENDGAGYLKSCKIKASKLGNVVANILALVWRGLYHLDPGTIKRTDWTDDYCIAINLQNQALATVDYNELTQLVVLAHDACIRVSIAGIAPRTMRLTFHARKREGNYSQRHPTIEDHTAAIRRTFTLFVEPTENAELGLGVPGAQATEGGAQ
jgi:hypothetical protein